MTSMTGMFVVLQDAHESGGRGVVFYIGVVVAVIAGILLVLLVRRPSLSLSLDPSHDLYALMDAIGRVSFDDVSLQRQLHEANTQVQSVLQQAAPAEAERLASEYRLVLKYVWNALTNYKHMWNNPDYTNAAIPTRLLREIRALIAAYHRSAGIHAQARDVAALKTIKLYGAVIASHDNIQELRDKGSSKA